VFNHLCIHVVFEHAHLGVCSVSVGMTMLLFVFVLLVLVSVICSMACLCFGQVAASSIRSGVFLCLSQDHFWATMLDLIFAEISASHPPTSSCRCCALEPCRLRQLRLASCIHMHVSYADLYVLLRIHVVLCTKLPDVSSQGVAPKIP
jgi:hypothetical protein